MHFPIKTINKHSIYNMLEFCLQTSGQRERMYHLFNPAVKMYEDNLYEILLREVRLHFERRTMKYLPLEVKQLTINIYVE